MHIWTERRGRLVDSMPCLLLHNPVLLAWDIVGRMLPRKLSFETTRLEIDAGRPTHQYPHAPHTPERLSSGCSSNNVDGNMSTHKHTNKYYQMEQIKDTSGTIYYLSTKDYSYNVLEMIACLLVSILWLTLCTHVAQWLPSPCLCAA